MAGTTGLEPATYGLTSQRSNQLSYVPRKGFQYYIVDKAASTGIAVRGAWAKQDLNL